MSANHDQVFVRTFLVVLGSLVAFTVVIMAIAAIITDDPAEGSYEEQRAQRIQDNTQPVFQVVTDPDAVQQVAMADTAGGDSGPAKSGPEVYSGLCAGCHDAGVAGAPKADDSGAWQARYEKGLETLYQHSINGFNAMPAKGGDPSLSDEEVEAAVRHMLGEAGIEVEQAESDEAAAAVEAGSA